MNYKDTLNMLTTDFEMKGNLAQKDPLFIKKWEESNLYNKLSTREGTEFILHDGPPYANGDIHIGHSLNKIIKDIIIRDAALQGKKIDWRTGWDTHGLPIELKVQQSGIKLSEVGKEEYLKACYKYAYKQVENQEKQFKKLGLLTDFDQKYLTLYKDFEARQIGVFNTMLNKGLVYQDLKPVYWSWSSETALAEAEIEYKDVKDISIFVKFKLDDEDINFVIWTTTPWTLPANVAIALGEKIEYVLAEVNGEKVVLASELVSKLSQDWEKEINVLEVIDASKYINKTATNPLNGNKSTIVWGHHVTTEGGTGLVHTAGGHGMDDYMIVKANDLELVVVQDDKGHMINAGEYDGMFYMKANKLIANKLMEEGSAISIKEIEHSVAIDWRTKEPVIYRATKQWFVSIEPIKDGLIEEIRNVNWVPGWGEERLIKMTENRADWCISRQRLWGVPIPVIYDENKQPIIDAELQANIVKAFEEEGILAWHNKEVKELLPSHIEYKEGMTKETDILDVWFDSGTSYELLEGKVADVYFEGNDQYRGWFNSSLINSFISKGHAPYKTVITHGMVTDSNGNKMSKSIGNTVDPLDITNIYGTDILRLWAAGSDYQDNPRISDDGIKQVAADYRSVRNTIKFILANTSDYNNEEAIDLNIIDKTILNEIAKSSSLIREKYAEYNFTAVTKELISSVASNGYIGWYTSYAKDVLYTHKPTAQTRRNIQYVLSKAIDFILLNFAPIMPVTIEEAWGLDGREGSVFEQMYPTFESAEASTYDAIKLVKEVVYKEYEALRTELTHIKSTEEIEVDLSLPGELMILKDSITRMLQVAKVNITEGELKASVRDFEGTKCPRCWKYFNNEDMNGEICSVCHDALN